MSHTPRPFPADASMPARTTHRPVPSLGEVRQPTRVGSRAA